MGILSFFGILFLVMMDKTIWIIFPLGQPEKLDKG